MTESLRTPTLLLLTSTMNTPDFPMDYSTLQSRDVNANLLPQFDNEDKTINPERVSIGTADPLSVYLRIRPFTEKEISDGKNVSCIKVLNDTDLITLPPLSSHAHKGLKKVLEYNLPYFPV